MRRLAGVPLNISYSKSAQKELAQLAKKDSDSLRAALDTLAISGIGDIEPLTGFEGVFKLRSGRTRAEFIVVQLDHLLTVIRVFYRQEGYKTKGRSRR
jgi:mRNA-degrading endonuclease RelE of RelBE toxin-antitoxin system